MNVFQFGLYSSLTIAAWLIWRVESNALAGISAAYCRYIFHFNKMPWADAFQVCQQSNRTLARIDDSPELTGVVSMAISKVKPIVEPETTLFEDFWIGLHAFDASPLINHLWADCAVMNTGAFDPWLDTSQQSSSGCVMLNSTDQKYRVGQCADARQYICEDISPDAAPCWNYHTYLDSILLTSLRVSQMYSTQPTDWESNCAMTCLSSCPGFYDTCTILTYDNVGVQMDFRGSAYLKAFIDYTSYPYISASIAPQELCSGVFSSTSSLFMDTSSFVESSSLETPGLTSVSDTISTAPVSTYYYTSSGMTSSQCYCQCAQYNNVTYTPEELQQKLDEIKKELTVNVKDTNSYKRTLISAPDDRVSAKSIGYVGAVILSLVGATLLLMDIPTIIKDTKTFFSNLSSCCKK